MFILKYRGWGYLSELGLSHMNFLASALNIQTLFENFAVVLGMLALLSLIYDWSQHIPAPPRKILLGMAFGLLAAASMLVTFEAQDGVFIDARNVIVAMSGIFIGPVAVCITAAIAAAMRIYMGGVGMMPGLAGLAIIAGSTSLLHIHFARRGIKFNFTHLTILSIVMPFAVMGVFFLMPLDRALKTFSDIGIWIYLDNMLWSMLLGCLLLQDQKKRDLIESLAASEKRADEALRAKSLFLAKMSHEIRTPLNAVMGFSDLLEKTEMNPTQKDHVSHILQACRSLLGIVNDILDFSSIESGKIHIRMTSFNLKTMIESCAALVRPESDRKHLDLKIEFHGDVPEFVISDELRLRQVITNLLGNAVKFTTHGYVKISVKGENTADQKWLMKISISDTGPGIDPAQHERIFQAFEQGDNSLTRNAGGTGLGLSITRTILGRLDGAVILESEPGRGSTFTITLPVQQSAQPLQPTQITIEKPKKPPKNAHILVVEDIQMNQMVLRAQLESEGYDVTLANNGREALQLLTDAKFDLVLMDIQMPIMNGIEAAERIREELKIDNHALPILAITAHALPMELKACLEAGMDDCLTKPVPTEILYRKLEEWLGLVEYDPFAIPAPSDDDTMPDHGILLDESKLSELINFIGADHAVKIYREFSGDIKRQLTVVHAGKPLDDGALHNLTSSAGNLGMNRLRHLCRSLMDAENSRQGPLSPDNAQIFENVVNDSISAFEQYLFRMRGNSRHNRD